MKLPDIETLTSLRFAGVKRVSFSGDDVSEVEFEPLSEQEVISKMETTADRVDATIRRQLDNEEMMSRFRSDMLYAHS